MSVEDGSIDPRQGLSAAMRNVEQDIAKGRKRAELLKFVAAEAANMGEAAVTVAMRRLDLQERENTVLVRRYVELGMRLEQFTRVPGKKG